MKKGKPVKKSPDGLKPRNGQQSPHAHYKDLADDAVALRIFDIIEHNPKISQKKITMHTGLAAGLVHSFMRKVISKGWVRANQVSAKRWLYFLTPEGFFQKSRLSMNYFSRAMSTYRMMQKLVREHLELCIANDWLKLVVVGDNELAEICVLNIKASNDFDLVAVVSGNGNDKTIVGGKILDYGSIENLHYDRLLICDAGFTHWHQRLEKKLDEKMFINLADLPEYP
ncbi:MAG: winged helix-turn-helix transcriptional regulator [Nitrospinota bacterium]